MSSSDSSFSLDLTDKGLPRSTLANAVAVLQHDPQWSPSILWHDDFLDRTRISNSPEREWRDDDDTRFTVYLQDVIGMVTMSESVAASAVRYVARQRGRHCVREYLAAQTWDRRPRLETACERYWGALATETQPEAYLRSVSANLFLGAVARVLQPGCQLDTMVIFEGAQGIGKSRALRVLGGAYYMLAAESVTHKDFFQGIPGKWFVEIGEMDSFSRAERERVKLAISTPVDRWRSSYGRRAEDHPRQCVFVGTTNRDDYGNDDTGLRRFLPVRCGAIDIIGLTQDRDQLFAEAYQRVQSGESWWLTPEQPTLDVQRARQAEDVWTPYVLDWIIGHANVTSAEVLEGALKMPKDKMGRPDTLRVGTILRLAGWTSRTVRRDGRPLKAWVPVTVDEDSVTI